MIAPYHSKALPPGAILREWRLEEVLGVGGFGIVYRARGVYFDELVAIKEYFPSAICDRLEGATVAPTDSSSEEIYTLGLHKFVEEAKLLWNLSKPERHPNIVSVRSLFEIHGTAYMVMDFESGVSLSQMLRDGRKFDEAGLFAVLKPIAEGLSRAHRAGVIHRDIKPANILVDASGRPVLIDFGSARFDAGQATSTKVTFYTPPYAAIEQYVKTYAQGPWTDIYALGVALYQCVTGEKPGDALERMTGDPGDPLSKRDWPGFSRTFCAAVDSAMAIRPADRPQSIEQWLALFEPRHDLAFDEPTRISVVQAESPNLAPVNGATRNKTIAPAAEQIQSGGPSSPAAPFRRLTLITGAATVVVVVAIAAAAIMTRPARQTRPSVQSAPVQGFASSTLLPRDLEANALKLVDEARTAGRGAKEVAALSHAQSQIAALSAEIHRLGAGGDASIKGPPLVAQLNLVAGAAATTEATALEHTVQARAREVQHTLASGALPPGAASALAGVLKTRTDFEATVRKVSVAQDAGASIEAVRQSLAAYAGVGAAYTAATPYYTSAKRAQLTAAIGKARDIERELEALAAGPRPGLFASRSRKQAYQTLQTNAALARSKDASLAALLQGASTSRDPRQLDAALAEAASVRQELANLYSASVAVGQAAAGQKSATSPAGKP